MTTPFLFLYHPGNLSSVIEARGERFLPTMTGGDRNSAENWSSFSFSFDAGPVMRQESSETSSTRAGRW